METTINIHTEIMKKIYVASSVLNITRTDVIIILMKKVMAEMQNHEDFGKLVRYQDKSPGNWHVFHIRLKSDDYEYLLDLRKLMKMSVSYILAIAVMKFINKLSRKNIADKYLYRNYIIIKELIDTVKTWRLVWGFPPGIADHL